MPLPDGFNDAAERLRSTMGGGDRKLPRFGEHEPTNPAVAALQKDIIDEWTRRWVAKLEGTGTLTRKLTPGPSTYRAEMLVNGQPRAFILLTRQR